MECTCALKDTTDDEGSDDLEAQNTTSQSIHDDLVDLNTRLKSEVQHLSEKLTDLQAEHDAHLKYIADCKDNCQTPLEDGSTNQTNTTKESEIAPATSSSPVNSPVNGVRGRSASVLAHRIEELEETLSVHKKLLKHSKQQWIGAITAQKELEECNVAAQSEIGRLSQLMDYQVRNIGSRRASAPVPVHYYERSSSHYSESPPEVDNELNDAPIEEDVWKQECTSHPAPPGESPFTLYSLTDTLALCVLIVSFLCLIR